MPFGTASLVLANQRRSDRRRTGLFERMAAEPPAPSVTVDRHS